MLLPLGRSGDETARRAVGGIVATPARELQDTRHNSPPSLLRSCGAAPASLPGQGVDNAFLSFPNYWKHLFEDAPLCGAVPLGGSPRMFAFLKHWRNRRGQALADADALMAKY